MGADTILQAKNQDEREKIWQARRQISLSIHDWAALYISEDVVVPIAAIADLVNRLSFFEDRYGIKIFAFGHAGDGNIHLNITAPSKNSMDRVNSGVKALLEQVLALGGTISGEHGIGLAKRQYFQWKFLWKVLPCKRESKHFLTPTTSSFREKFLSKLEF